MATETAVDVVMPQMGVSVSEGTITKWLKQEGDPIEADEPLLEISTDKVDTEVPSPASGTLTQILVQEGETVAVGTKLAQIGGSAAAQTPAPEPVVVAPPPPAAASLSPQPQAAEPSGNGGRAFISPVVARIASEHGVDPAQIAGTGRGGRVTKQDILAFVAQPVSAPAAQPTAKVEEAAPAPPVAPPPAPQAPSPPPPAAASLSPQPQAADGESLEPVTAMRRGIAEHMRRSLDTAAHVTSAIEVDMSRDRRRARAAQEGVPGRVRRQPDVSRIHRACDGPDAARASVRERRAARRVDRDAKLRQPRYRGRARRTARD